MNLSENLRLFHEGLTPWVRNRQHPNWIRLHEDQVFYYRSQNHGQRLVLSIAFRFSCRSDDHQFALFYPYSYTKLVNFVTRWSIEVSRRLEVGRQSRRSAKRDLQHRSPKLVASTESTGSDQLRTRSSLGCRKFERYNYETGDEVNLNVETIGMSKLSKPIHFISIKVSTGERKPQVIIACRSAGNLDGAASLVCQGMMDYLLSDSPVAEVIRQNIDFSFVPMIDPDSVWVGNSRTDLMGQTNWCSKLVETNRSIYSNLIKMMDIFKNICANCDRAVMLELRINLSLIGSRICGHHYEDGLRMEQHLSFPRILARFADDFYMENCIFTRPVSVSSHLFDSVAPAKGTDRYSLEVSPFAYYKRSLTERNYEEYGELRYLTLGKALVYSLLELLKPEDKILPHCVSELLDSFHPRADDIDDLLLDIKCDRPD